MRDGEKNDTEEGVESGFESDYAGLHFEKLRVNKPYFGSSETFVPLVSLVLVAIVVCGTDFCMVWTASAISHILWFELKFAIFKAFVYACSED